MFKVLDKISQADIFIKWILKLREANLVQPNNILGSCENMAKNKS